MTVIESNSFVSFYDTVPVKYYRAPYPEVQAKGTIEFTSTDLEKLSGRWTGEAGSEGIFHFQKAKITSENENALSAINEAIAADLQLGVVVLFRDELAGLIATIRSLMQDSPQVPVTITTNIPGERIIQFSTEFLSRKGLPRRLDNLQIQAVDQSQPIHRTIHINLADAETKVTVQSSDRVWTHGTKESLRVALSPYVSWWHSLFKKHALNLNGLALLLALTFLPEMAYWARVKFLAVTILLISLFYLFHKRIARHRIWTDNTGRSVFYSSQGQLGFAILGVFLALLIPIFASIFTSGSIPWPFSSMINWLIE